MCLSGGNLVGLLRLFLGESPPNEEPINPFGMERLQTAEEELGYRLPFTTKEREFSLLTIQVYSTLPQ